MAVARLVVDQWLRQRRPAPDLADWLVCVWRGDLGTAAMPLPDERLDLVWVDDGSLWLSGPETTSWPRGDPPATTAVGVAYKPGVGPPMLHLAASESATPGSAWRRCGGIATQASWPSASRATPTTVGGQGSWNAPWVAWRHGHDRSTRSPWRSRAGCTSPTRRRCAGCRVPPAGRSASSTVAAQRRSATGLRGSHQGPRRLAALAAAAGDVDQPHFAREVRAIMGTTPTRLLRAH
jgi:hypothetical protein